MRVLGFDFTPGKSATVRLTSAVRQQLLTKHFPGGICEVLTNQRPDRATAARHAGVVANFSYVQNSACSGRKKVELSVSLFKIWATDGCALAPLTVGQEQEADVAGFRGEGFEATLVFFHALQIGAGAGIVGAEYLLGFKHQLLILRFAKKQTVPDPSVEPERTAGLIQKGLGVDNPRERCGHTARFVFFVAVQDDGLLPSAPQRSTAFSRPSTID